MEELVQEIRSLENKLRSLRSELKSMSDGYIYLTCLRCYGSIQWSTHSNSHTVQELCNSYNGDDGIVDVYTNNQSPDIINYSGDMQVMTIDELKDLSKENVSMSKAVVNWITKSMP